jgi:lysophospholipase L1-like esterase
MRVPRRSTIALATAGALASTGTAYLGARNLLAGQASHARTVIPKSWDIPPRADGVYSPGGGPVQRWHRSMAVDLHLMIFGDSTATGYGCMIAEEVPGVRIARGLAERTGKRIRLSTKAIVGATSKGVCGQVDAMFVAGSPPDVAVMMLGANDVTALNGISQSAQRLSLAVRKLRARGAVVVVGTCPDLGVISAIPQPLRSLAHARTSQLARAQTAAVRAAGGVPVPLAQLLAPEFRAAPDVMFSADGFHPSATAYALAAEALLPALCAALGENAETKSSEAPEDVSASAATPVLPQGYLRLSGMSRLWRRPEPGLPAPSSSRPVAAD